jgi:hypothetical protein
MLQDHVTPLPLALVAAVHLACMLASVAVLRSGPSRVPGWRVVGPGSMHWFAFLGCWALAALISWVWLFVGSARLDAEAQMRYALGLVLAFGAGAAWSGFHIGKLRRMALRWRGAAIQWRERGRDVVQDIGDFDAFRRAFSGAFLFRFRNGVILKLDPYARNAEDLMAAISERTGRSID